MKKLILIQLFFLLASCSSSKNCMYEYLSENIKKNDFNDYILCKENKNDRTLRIYSDIDIITNKNASETYKVEDYKYLENKIKKDTIQKYWDVKDNISSKFDTIISLRDKNWIDYKSKKANAKVYYHIISKPVFIKNRKIAIFYYKVFLDKRTRLEEVVIVMKKVKGKWILLEKVPSQRIQ